MSEEMEQNVEGVELVKAMVMIPRPNAFNYYNLKTGAESEFVASNKRAFFEGDVIYVERAKAVKYIKHGWIKALKES